MTFEEEIEVLAEKIITEHTLPERYKFEELADSDDVEFATLSLVNLSFKSFVISDSREAFLGELIDGRYFLIHLNTGNEHLGIIPYCDPKDDHYNLYFQALKLFHPLGHELSNLFNDEKEKIKNKIQENRRRELYEEFKKEFGTSPVIED